MASDSVSHPGFLAALAQELLDQYGSQLSEVRILFPNRRAGLVFRHELARLAGKALWAPRIDTLSAWLQSLHPLPLADTLLLLELLWEGTDQADSLEAFTPIGLRLLADFADMDMALANPQEAFATAGLSYADPGAREAFDNPLAQRYAHWLAQAAALYTHLQNRLRSMGYTSEGQLLRDIAMDPGAYMPAAARIPTWLAGFDQLNRAETRVTDWLASQHLLHTRWDVDSWYTLPPAEGMAARRAGDSFRRLWQSHPVLAPQQPVPGRLSLQSSELHTYPLSSAIAQVSALAQVLQERLTYWQQTLPDSDALEQQLRRIAIVLPDESLLVPLLEHLPPALTHCNITMGYPARHSVLFALLEAWVRLQEAYRPGEGFYHAHLAQVLSHPLLLSHRPDLYRNLYQHYIRKNNIHYWHPPAHSQSDDLLAVLLDHAQSANEALLQLRHLYDRLHELVREQGELRDAFHREFLNLLHNRLNQLEALVERQPHLRPADVRGLLLRLLAAQRIPFSGEPLGGVQIMGLLETRALQFEEVYILSANEGHLPPGHRPQGSLLPQVRRQLGMSGPGETEAQYSYLFWRLLQGVPQVHIFHVTEMDETGGGEPSRFLRQITLDWALVNPHLKLHTHLFNQQVMAARPLTLTPQEEDVASLLAHPEPGTGPPYVRLSPTSLVSYLRCPLQFWFQYVQRLQPTEEVTEDPDARQFGSLVHKALELLYSPCKGQLLQAQDLQRLQAPAAVEQALQSAAAAEWQVMGQTDSGRLVLLLEVAREMVAGVLRLDEARVPFTLTGLETNLSHEWTEQLPGRDAPLNIVLTGWADRLDTLPGGVVIWDYKTGKVQERDLRAGTPADLTAAEERGSRTKDKALQTLLYGWLWWKMYGELPYQAGVITLRSSPPQAYTLSLPFDLPTLTQAETTLRELVREILAPGRTFAQTDDLQVCKYCHYNRICQRNPSVRTKP
ncbi:MAG: PD-(D/E)XK nuclease family protein [Bacteroidetes bacterium]|nr:PD-(D/E)XK nuclease family protein [Bacteroidota bacterium]